MSTGPRREAERPPRVFVSPNCDGTFTVGKGSGNNVSAFRVTAFELLDLSWAARYALRAAAPPPGVPPVDGPDGGDDGANLVDAGRAAGS